VDQGQREVAHARTVPAGSDSRSAPGRVAGAELGWGDPVGHRRLVEPAAGRVTVPGLEPDRGYRVEAIFPTPADAGYAHNYTQVQPPAWLAGGAEANGRFLAEVGLPMPILNPEHAVLLKFTAL